LKIAIFAYSTMIVDPSGDAQQHKCNLYIAEKYVYWATIVADNTGLPSFV